MAGPVPSSLYFLKKSSIIAALLAATGGFVTVACLAAAGLFAVWAFAGKKQKAKQVSGINLFKQRFSLRGIIKPGN
jgi:hypothetical protein